MTIHLGEKTAEQTSYKTWQLPTVGRGERRKQRAMPFELGSKKTSMLSNGHHQATHGRWKGGLQRKVRKPRGPRKAC